MSVVRASAVCFLNGLRANFRPTTQPPGVIEVTDQNVPSTSASSNDQPKTYKETQLSSTLESGLNAKTPGRGRGRGRGPGRGRGQKILES